MAISSILNVTYTIQDAKGKKSRIVLHFPVGARAYPIVLDDFITSTAVMIDNLTKGRLLSAAVNWTYNLHDAGLKSAPLPDSDVEEGAFFRFYAGVGSPVTFRMATFDEAFMHASGSHYVDLSLPDVEAFIQRIIQGRTIVLANVSPSDDHGADIDRILYAADAFRHYQPDNW